MSFYGSKVSLADRLFRKYGKDITLHRVTEGALNPGTGYFVTGTSADYTPKGVELRYDRRYVDGKRILGTDRQVYLSAQGLAITPDPKTDKLVIDGASFEIVEVIPLQPGDTVVFYELQARGG